MKYRQFLVGDCVPLLIVGAEIRFAIWAMVLLGDTAKLALALEAIL